MRSMSHRVRKWVCRLLFFTGIAELNAIMESVDGMTSTVNERNFQPNRNNLEDLSILGMKKDIEAKWNGDQIYPFHFSFLSLMLFLWEKKKSYPIFVRRLPNVWALKLKFPWIEREGKWGRGWRFAPHFLSPWMDLKKALLDMRQDLDARLVLSPRT